MEAKEIYNLEKLEDCVDRAFRQLHIKQNNRNSVEFLLSALKLKHEYTYAHSLNVALIAKDISDYLGFQQKPLFFAGLLHDVGKLTIRQELFNNGKYSEEDAKEMEMHVLNGYYIASGVHEFSAQILLRHHHFQDNGYPALIPGPLANLGKKATENIVRYARLLSLADFYVALTTRDDSRERITPDMLTNIRILIVDKKPHDYVLADELLRNGILDNSKY